MTNPRRLSTVAAESEVKAPACRIIETLCLLHGQATGAWAMSGARGDRPEHPVVDLDRHGEPIDEEMPFLGLPDEVEVSQFWIVSEWLARRLCEHGDHCVLVCDETYVWCRTGCGYPVEDDLRFLDEPETATCDTCGKTVAEDACDIAGDADTGDIVICHACQRGPDPTEDDHARVIDETGGAA